LATKISESLNLKEMQELRKKEKKLRKQIRWIMILIRSND